MYPVYTGLMIQNYPDTFGSDPYPIPCKWGLRSNESTLNHTLLLISDAPREEEKTLEPTSPEDKTLDCVDMDIDDDDAPATNAQETNALETNVQDINAQEANLQDTNTESATAQDADKNNASCGGESVEKGLVVDQTVNDTSVKTDVKTSQINCTPESTVVNT